MFKITFVFALCCVALLQVDATPTRPARPTRKDRDFCRQLNLECLRHEKQVGKHDDTVTIYNKYCINQMGKGWKIISRCQLVRASCELTMMRCGNLTCKNVAAVLRRKL